MPHFYRTASIGLLALVLASTPATATLISVIGEGIIVPAPASVLNDTVTTPEQWGFNERQGVLLAAPLLVDGGSIAAGSLVDSHMIFLNSAGGQIDTDATWTFSGIVLGVMSDTPGTLEAASTALLGLPGTAYATFPNRGLEGNPPDFYLGVGTNILDVSMRVTQPGDWIRVITQASPAGVPDSGSSALLLGFVLGAIALALKRLSRGL